MATDDRAIAGDDNPRICRGTTVVEQFRVPFGRGFGYDDQFLVYRRIKS